MALRLKVVWESNAMSNAIGYAQHYSRSHDAVIRVYDAVGNGDRDPRAQGRVSRSHSSFTDYSGPFAAEACSFQAVRSLSGFVRPVLSPLPRDSQPSLPISRLF